MHYHQARQSGVKIKTKKSVLASLHFLKWVNAMNKRGLSAFARFMNLFIGIAIIALSFFVYFTFFSPTPTAQEPMQKFTQTVLYGNRLSDLLATPVDADTTIGKLIASRKYAQAKPHVERILQDWFGTERLYAFWVDDAQLKEPLVLYVPATKVLGTHVPDAIMKLFIKPIAFVTILPRPDQTTVKVILEIEP